MHLDFYSRGRRFACRALLGRQRDLDGMGNPAAAGTGCLACLGCEQPRGDLGIAGEGGAFTIIGASSGLALRWPCPTCSQPVMEDIEALSIEATAREIAADPLCHRCRQKAKGPTL